MQLTFTALPDEYAIARLPADAAVPDWAAGDGLTSITRAPDELSIVCPARHIPPSVRASRGYSALRVDTLAALDEPGVVMAAVTPISSAGLGVFVISTHLRDYILVQSSDLPAARTALTAQGHTLA